VLVAGSGLIIRLRKDIVGSTPTRPTIVVKNGSDFSEPFLFGGEKPYLMRQYATSAVLLIRHCRFRLGLLETLSSQP
jgi:hypothetical protein